MLSPQVLAVAYDRYLATRWRGDVAAGEPFAVWLEAHWRGQAPPEPLDVPEAVSVLGGAGAGVRWYAREGAILGYVAGRPRGCYWVPEGAAAPTVHLLWEIPADWAAVPDSEATA